MERETGCHRRCGHLGPIVIYEAGVSERYLSARSDPCCRIDEKMMDSVDMSDLPLTVWDEAGYESLARVGTKINTFRDAEGSREAFGKSVTRIR